MVTEGEEDKIRCQIRFARMPRSLKRELERTLEGADGTQKQPKEVESGKSEDHDELGEEDVGIDGVGRRGRRVRLEKERFLRRSAMLTCIWTCRDWIRQEEVGARMREGGGRRETEDRNYDRSRKHARGVVISRQSSTSASSLSDVAGRCLRSDLGVLSSAVFVNKSPL